MGGICIDLLLNILICDEWIVIVYIIDKDGEFLIKLLIWLFGIFELYSLCYDFNIYFFWVGLRSKNMVCVYSYIIINDDLIGIK